MLNFQGSKFSQTVIFDDFVEKISQIHCMCMVHTEYTMGIAYKPDRFICHPLKLAAVSKAMPYLEDITLRVFLADLAV